MPQNASRTARLEARIAPEALNIIKRAADLQGRSLSDFVVAAAQEAAHRTIEEAQIIRLSVEDQRRFAEALLNPAPLAPAMERAIERYRALIEPTR
jgi:uncharacterized protein (DUF1778 family)